MNLKKRLIAALLLLFVLSTQSFAYENPPELSGEYAVLFVAETGQVLYGSNEHVKMPPASITKIMTALVVLENCGDLSQTTTATDNAIYSIEPGSTHIALDIGETTTVEDLLGAALVQSANDASSVLAEHIGGSLSGFADMMNQTARRVGATSTNFVNAHGLDDEEHYTTAYDMALITRAALEHPDFIRLAGARSFTMKPTNKADEERFFSTKQNMLSPSSRWYDAFVIAGKNGYTTKAHHTLVTVRREDDVTLIAVTLSESSKEKALEDTRALFDYGLEGYQKVSVSLSAQADAALEAFENADVDSLRNTFVMLPSGSKAGSITVTCDAAAAAPELAVQHSGETLYTIPLSLLTEGAPDEDGFIQTMGSTAPSEEESAGAFQTVVKIFVITFVCLFGLFLIFFSYRTYRIRKQRKRIRMMRQRAHQQARYNPDDRF